MTHPPKLNKPGSQPFQLNKLGIGHPGFFGTTFRRRSKCLVMKALSVFFVFVFAFVFQVQSQPDAMPPNPLPGTCYVRTAVPDVYEMQERRVLVRPSYTRLEKMPAEYETIEERVLVKPAHKTYLFTPAEFKTVTEEIQVVEPYDEITIVPAKLGVKMDTIEIRPRMGRWEYQTSAGNCQSPDPRDCMVLRYVERPAETKVVPQQVVERDATFAKTQKGGKTATVARQVLVKEATVQEIEAPAEYQTVTRQVLKHGEEVREIEVPAEYAIETVEILKEKGGAPVWEAVDCRLVEFNELPVFYQTGSAILTAGSRQAIDEILLKFLLEKPNLRIEINTHTDARGSAEDNRKLSQSRADAIAERLVSQGIARNRIVAKGYGESRLKNRCKDGVNCLEEEHLQNRRTEFRVLSN